MYSSGEKGILYAAIYNINVLIAERNKYKNMDFQQLYAKLNPREFQNNATYSFDVYVDI